MNAASPPSPEEFHALHMPVRSFTSVGASSYHVYKSSGESVNVKAETVIEALKASGVESPVRVVREIHGREVLLDLQKILDKQAEKPAEQAAAPAAETPAASPEAAAAPAESPPAS